MSTETEFQEKRLAMVEQQVLKRGIRHTELLNAMRSVPRHLFIPAESQDKAYNDGPLPIGEEQTISQPYMVALMTECLAIEKSNIVLEVGTGSGYQTAILSHLCDYVVTIERIRSLSERAQKLLNELNCDNIQFIVGNGAEGIIEDEKTFDGIMITAATQQPLPHLLGQLRIGGRMIVPEGPRDCQTLKLYTKTDGQIQVKDICQCVFVPLINS